MSYQTTFTSMTSGEAIARVHTYFFTTRHFELSSSCSTRSPRSHLTRPPPDIQLASARGPSFTRSVYVHDRPDIKHAKNEKVFSLSYLPRVASPAPTKSKDLFVRSNPHASSAAATLPCTNGERTRAARSTHPPTDLVTNTFVPMAGRASNAAGSAAGRYDLRPQGLGGLRGAAALSDSPLLGRLLEDLAAVFDAEVLPLLDPTTRALLLRVGQACRDAVLWSPKLAGAGRIVGVPLRVKEFIASVQLLAWAKGSGCPWVASTCAVAAKYGQLEALQWAREHGCEWDAETCRYAALGGHLEVLRWAREHHCPWNARTCTCAAQEGHLAVLEWAREHGCEWDAETCTYAAYGGHLEVLKWAREHHCEWDAETCASAAQEGHLECESGRASTAASGTRRRVSSPRWVGS